MGKLGDELRKKYRTPREAIKALGLDEALLDIPHLALDGAITMKPTRLAAHVLNLTAANVAPLLALDAKLELPKKLFASITSKNFKDSKTDLLAGIRTALDGKLRKGIALDASMERVGKVMDEVSNLFESDKDKDKGADESVSEEQAAAMEAAAHGQSTLGIPKTVGQEFADKDNGTRFDSAPIMEWARGKGMSEDDMTELSSMFPKPAVDEDPDADEDDDEAAAEKKKKEADAAKAKKDAADKKAKDESMKDMVTKPAMDAALKKHGEDVTRQVRETERGIRAAIEEVKPWTGTIAAGMAFDSATDVYRHALTVVGHAKAKTLHADALLPVLQAQPRPGTKNSGERQTPVLGMDESAQAARNKLVPGLDRIEFV